MFVTPRTPHKSANAIALTLVRRRLVGRRLD